ncbi:MAG: hypothetical protein HQ559_13635 [Lentisphaerae bacterium]|nr:hypothetical protein [Lentisphaerota bacterium]
MTTLGLTGPVSASMKLPVLWRVIEIPGSFCITECEDGRNVTYGGDIRIGDLRNRGQADFLVYRSVDDAWDDGHPRAICSGHGLVLDDAGKVILELGADLVPHGQEVRVGRFRSGDSTPQMIVRGHGHSPRVLLVDVHGEVLRELELNPSPNNTGMETVRWCGEDGPDLLCNGGTLWDPLRGTSMPLPDLPCPEGRGRMDWYHCIPANVCGDEREEVVLYSPWTTRIHIYTQTDSNGIVSSDFKAGPRQYNARLMD